MKHINRSAALKFSKRIFALAAAVAILTAGAEAAVNVPHTYYGKNIYAVTYHYSPVPDDGCEGDCGSGCNALPIAAAVGSFAIPIAWFAARRKK